METESKASFSTSAIGTRPLAALSVECPPGLLLPENGEGSCWFSCHLLWEVLLSPSAWTGFLSGLRSSLHPSLRHRCQCPCLISLQPCKLPGSRFPGRLSPNLEPQASQILGIDGMDDWPRRDPKWLCSDAGPDTIPGSQLCSR